MPGKDSSQPEKHMVKFSIYLYRECARARQEGVVLVKRDPLQSPMIELARAGVRRGFSP
jgi:hypothetical protein